MPPKGRAAASQAAGSSQVDISVAAVLSAASTPVASTSTSQQPQAGSDEGTPIDSGDADKPSTAGPDRPKKKSQRPSWSVRLHLVAGWIP
jgi:cell division septation protein DedD